MNQGIICIIVLWLFLLQTIARYTKKILKEFCSLKTWASTICPGLNDNMVYFTFFIFIEELELKPLATCWLTSASPPATRSPWWSPPGAQTSSSLCVRTRTVFATNTNTCQELLVYQVGDNNIYYWPPPPSPPQWPPPAWWWCWTASRRGCRPPWGRSVKEGRSVSLCGSSLRQGWIVERRV